MIVPSRAIRFEILPTFDYWAAGVRRQYSSLGMASPFLGGRIQFLDAFGFQRAMLAREKAVWAELHITPAHCAGFHAPNGVL